MKPGTEEEQFELDLTQIPKQHSEVGIVDADSIMFNLGWYFEKANLLPPGGDYESSIVVPDFVDKAVDTFLNKLRKQMNVETLHLHFTGGSKNKGLFEEFMGRPMNEQFRNTLGNTYKSNRSDAPLPTGYHYTLRSLLQQPHAYIHDQWEADEAVILHKKLNPNWVLSSNDKDVYKQHHGKSWAYDRRKQWFDIDKDYANYFAFLQAITGDPTDGFGGVPGIGPKKAETFVDPSKTPGDNWQGVLDAFKSKGLDEREATMNIRFASMHQLRLGEDGLPYIDIWKPNEFHLTPSWP